MFVTVGHSSITYQSADLISDAGLYQVLVFNLFEKQTLKLVQTVGNAN